MCVRIVNVVRVGAFGEDAPQVSRQQTRNKKKQPVVFIVVAQGQGTKGMKVETE